MVFLVFLRVPCLVLDIFRFVTLDFFGHNKLKNYFSEDEVQLLQRHKGIVISGSSTIN